MYLVVNKSGEFYLNTIGTFIITFIPHLEINLFAVSHFFNYHPCPIYI